MSCPVLIWVYRGIFAIAIYAAYKLFKRHQTSNTLKKWSKTKKDVVIVHGFPPAKSTPNASPFILKVETFCRLGNIRYEIDTKDPFGPKGKTPWISFNGEHISDSEFIIDFLKKKFEKSFSHNYTNEQLAIATVVRIMLDEHFFWGYALDKFKYGGWKTVEEDFDMPFISVFKYIVRRNVVNKAWSQGVGRHSQKEVEEIMTKDLRAVSVILGNKKFICGDEPCEMDCGIFAHLAQSVWSLHESPYTKLCNDELVNLKEYCYRMRERLWQDWELNLKK